MSNIKIKPPTYSEAEKLFRECFNDVMESDMEGFITLYCVDGEWIPCFYVPSNIENKYLHYIASDLIKEHISDVEYDTGYEQAVFVVRLF